MSDGDDGPEAAPMDDPPPDQQWQYPGVNSVVQQVAQQHREQTQELARRMSQPILKSFAQRPEWRLGVGPMVAQASLRAAAPTAMSLKIAEAAHSPAFQQVWSSISKNAAFRFPVREADFAFQPAAVRQMLALQSPLRDALAHFEQTGLPGFTAQQVAFARRVAEATPPEVDEEVIEAAEAVKITDEAASGIAQWVSEQVDTLQGKDEEYVFWMTYSLLFVLAVNLIVVNPALGLTVLATIGQSAHSIAWKVAGVSQAQYRRILGSEVAGEATGPDAGGA